MTKSIVEQLESADLEMQTACASLVMQCELLIANINAMRVEHRERLVSREIDFTVPPDQTQNQPSQDAKRPFGDQRFGNL